MQKIFHIFILLFLSTHSVFSKEPAMAILVNIESNDIQQFRIGSYQFDCTAYGVLSIDELYRESAFNSSCKESIKNFYKKRSDLKYYTNSKLKVMQSYSIEFKNNGCIVNASGGKSLSEFLLEEGLAVKKPFFKDKELGSYLHKSQLKAKMNRKGIWAENITRECISNIYKK